MRSLSSCLLLLPSLALAACLQSQPGAAPDATTAASALDAAASTTASADTAQATTYDAGPTVDPRPDATTDTAPPDPNCTPAGTGCMSPGECCAGTFCAGGPYIYGECTAPQPLGAVCDNDSWCATGTCVDGVCAAASCLPVDSVCEVGSACCSGFCTTVDYGPTRCSPRLALDAFCMDDAWCESGLCLDNACAAPCQTADDGCYYDSDCCADLYCTWSEDRGRNLCAPKGGIGATCDWDHACLDGRCVEGVCQAIACGEVDTQCYYAAECCSGACSWDGISYAMGYCITPLAAGAACTSDGWCSSGHCIDGVCQ